ncbi:MAG: tetratricopeptide repeat protein, partial [Candidatus Eremiobacteraeota bacterium]|nr:tetratricopeptide repeat protein [Candidatus Eremiobacteraeota bacterium]
VTTREVLDVPGEAVYRVPPFRDGEAAALFANRASAATASFALDSENAVAIAQICKRLDGIPLAIELAASRMGTITVGQLRERLDDRFSVLAGGNRTALPRQQTLRGMIEWSYQLLNEPERVLLRRLAAFAGSFSFEAANAICTGAPIDATAALDLLSHLVSKSLVQFDAEGARYWMLETTREYALERLDEAGEREALVNAHAAYYEALAHDAVAQLRTAKVEESLATLTAAWDDIRSTLQRLLDAPDPARGCKLVTATSSFCLETGRLSEGLLWVERALEKADCLDETDRVTLMGSALRLTSAHGDFELLGRRGRALLETYRKINDPNGIAFANTCIASSCFYKGDSAGARHHYGASLDIYRSLGMPDNTAVILSNLGNVALTQDADYDEARRLFEEAVALAKQIPPSRILGTALDGLSRTAFCQKRYRESVEAALASAEVFGRLGNAPFVAMEHINLALAALEMGERYRALELLTGAYEPLCAAGQPVHVTRLFQAWFAVACDLGLFDVAATLAGFLVRYRSDNGLNSADREVLDWQSSRVARLAAALPPEERARIEAAGSLLSLQQAHDITEKILVSA